MIRAIHNAWGSMKRDGSFPPFFPAAQPVSLERRHLAMIRNKRYFVSEKTDGIRMGLICMNTEAVFINRKMETKPVNFYIPRDFYKGTMLDGEMLLDGTYVVYDAVMLGGRNIRHLNFIKRLEYIYKYLQNVPIIIKKFYCVHNIRHLIDNLSTHDTDGLIFTPCEEPVRVATNETMFKWKRLENITIDFMNIDSNLYTQNRNVPIKICETNWAHEYPNNTIIECSYVDGTWKPLKIRTDKDYPNSIKTYNRTLSTIRENITLEEIVLYLI